jgi:hypothetical protein
MKRRAYSYSGGALGDPPVVGAVPTPVDHIYINVGAINATTATTANESPSKSLKQAVFRESRNSAIVEKANEWNFSIVRFNMDGIGALLPLWIPQILTGQTDINKTAYSVFISRVAVAPASQTPISLQFQSVFPDITPAAPINQQDVGSLYYYGKSYQQFTDMVNVALDAALANAGLASSVVCQLTYDGSTKLFSFTLANGFFNGAYTLQFNPLLASLFNGFRWRYSTSAPFANSLPGFATLVLPHPPHGTNQQVVQDFNSTSNGLWSPIDGFSFVTNLIPVIPEQGTAPTQVGESNVGAANGSTGQAFASVLTDYNNTGYPEDTLSAIEYVPQAEYRIANLSGAVPVQTLDVQVFWRFRLTGDPIPVYMPANSSMSLKMMLRRKQAI